MTIRHGQFVQDVEVIEMMYRSLDGLRRDGIPKSRQWQAVMAEGPMDQIRETQAEMHEHLKLPYPVLTVPLPTDADPAPPMRDNLDFSLALDQLCRLYRALGALHKELYHYRPKLYATLAPQFLPHLYAVQSVMHAYLEWDAIEATLAEMARQFAPADGAALDVSSPAPELSEPKS